MQKYKKPEWKAKWKFWLGPGPYKNSECVCMNESESMKGRTLWLEAKTREESNTYKRNGLTKWVVEYAITSLSHNGAKHALLCVKLIFLYSLCIIAYFNASTCLEFQDDTVILDITSINYRQNALLVTDNLQFHFIYFSMINFLFETSDPIRNDQGYFVWNQ